MKYLISGRLRSSKTYKSEVIDECEDLESAEFELYKLQGDHPNWMFWIDGKNEDEEEIQQSVCSKP